MITNPKIERKKAEIVRTEIKIAELKAKHKEQKNELILLENDEIVALYRKEVYGDDHLSVFRKTQRKNQTQEGKEEISDAIDEE